MYSSLMELVRSNCSLLFSLSAPETQKNNNTVIKYSTFFYTHIIVLSLFSFKTVVLIHIHVDQKYLITLPPTKTLINILKLILKLHTSSYSQCRVSFNVEITQLHP